MCCCIVNYNLGICFLNSIFFSFNLAIFAAFSHTTLFSIQLSPENPGLPSSPCSLLDAGAFERRPVGEGTSKPRSCRILAKSELAFCNSAIPLVCSSSASSNRAAEEACAENGWLTYEGTSRAESGTRSRRGVVQPCVGGCCCICGRDDRGTRSDNGMERASVLRSCCICGRDANGMGQASVLGSCCICGKAASGICSGTGVDVIIGSCCIWDKAASGMRSDNGIARAAALGAGCTWGKAESGMRSHGEVARWHSRTETRLSCAERLRGWCCMFAIVSGPRLNDSPTLCKTSFPKI